MITYNGKGWIFLPLLAVLFIGLKLTGYIDWSWFWVLSPIWIPFAWALTTLLIMGIAILFGAKLKIKRKGPY